MPRFNSTANGLASLGRNGDTMLMHVNPDEVAGLSALLGSDPTVNPDTGLPEAFNWLSPIMGLFGSVAEMGAGANIAEELASSEFAKGLSEYIDPETLGTIGAGVGGSLLGAGIGAGTAALTGQSASGGAMGGAFSGLLSGGYGGMESKELLGVPEPSAAEKKMDELFYDTEDSPIQTTSPLTASATEAPGFFKTNFGSMKGMKNFATEHGSVPMMAMSGEQAILANAADKQRQKQRQNMLMQLVQPDISPLEMGLYNYTRRGYAGGALVTREPNAYVGQAAEQGIPITMRMPDRYAEDIKDMGGIGALLPQMAQGGYINTQPFDPASAHPQGMIHRATPYPGSAPQRHEVIGNEHDAMFADGGFIDGEGDGMSDDVDADIDGIEPVKVADGEFIIPKDIVDMVGVDALDDMMKRVRMAAHGSDKQIRQDAAKKAFLQTVK